VSESRHVPGSECEGEVDETGEGRASPSMEGKRREMMEAFSRLTPEERLAEAERRLDEVLDRMAELRGITREEAYEQLVGHRDRACRSLVREE